MRRAPGSEAETRLRERRLEDRSQHLHQRLLADPVHQGRDTERALGRRPWLVDLHPEHRPWPVATRLQLLVQEAQVVVTARLEPLDGHPIDPARPLVLLHLLPGTRQVAPVVDPADQRVRLVLHCHARLSYLAPGQTITGVLGDDASVIAAATISPSSRTRPPPSANRHSQRDPFPGLGVFWITGRRPSPGTVPRFLLVLGSPVPRVTPTSRTASAATSPSGLYAHLPGPVGRDRTRPPGVTHGTFASCRPHTPCCAQAPQVFPSPP